jgi:hypothetical protein
MIDERLGKVGQDGAVESWPAVTITGRAYVRPVSAMVKLGGGYFAVIDDDPIPFTELEALIEVLKEQVNEPTRHRTTGGRSRRAADPVVDAVFDPEE